METEPRPIRIEDVRIFEFADIYPFTGYYTEAGLNRDVIRTILENNFGYYSRTAYPTFIAPPYCRDAEVGYGGWNRIAEQNSWQQATRQIRLGIWIFEPESQQYQQIADNHPVIIKHRWGKDGSITTNPTGITYLNQVGLYPDYYLTSPPIMGQTHRELIVDRFPQEREQEEYQPISVLLARPAVSLKPNTRERLAQRLGIEALEQPQSEINPLEKALRILLEEAMKKLSSR
ncbi:MAG: hypothetical protein QY330_00915 [Candidatus Dojkabacteria bacterium]|nr:MAG: hypothetical protein QY330_00915 [Candidatus Dojkabacteria bacterium]